MRHYKRSLCARYRTLVTYQTFDCLIKVKTEFLNKSQETYNENEDIAVMMFDISHGYIRCVVSRYLVSSVSGTVCSTSWCNL